ncbi:hypothetical protein DAI22_11g080185 [Oryza sativa Japonica Group]|nr:hypothetical protein DAI22_11g080185 [Oryza sativa Japonica Group]
MGGDLAVVDRGFGSRCCLHGRTNVDLEFGGGGGGHRSWCSPGRPITFNGQDCIKIRARLLPESGRRRCLGQMRRRLCLAAPPPSQIAGARWWSPSPSLSLHRL